MLRFTATRVRIILAIVFGVGSLLPAPPAQAAATPVSSCPFTATSSVIVTQDLTCNGTDGINVGAPNITIDLGGHTLRSDRTAGHDGITNFFLLSSSYPDVTVRNGVLRNFDNGILTGSTATKMTVENVVVSGNASRGIDITGDGVSIESVTSSGNAEVGALVSGDDARIKSVTASGNGEQGLIVSGDDNAITSVRASGNGHTGVTATGLRMEIASVDVSDNALNGLGVTGNLATIKSVTASGNLSEGLFITGLSHELVSILATGNGQSGIRVEGNDAVVTKSTASGNDVAAVTAGLIVIGLRAVVSGNRAEGNGFVNGVSDGAGWGIHVPTPDTPEENIARGNDAATECQPTFMC